MNFRIDSVDQNKKGLPWMGISGFGKSKPIPENREPLPPIGIIRFMLITRSHPGS